MDKTQAHSPHSLLQFIEVIGRDAFLLVGEILQLFLLELKLAGKGLTTALVMVVMICMLLLSAWFSLLGGLGMWLVSLKMNLMVVFGLLSAINLVIAIILGCYVVRLSRRFQFKETRWALTKDTSHESYST